MKSNSFYEKNIEHNEFLIALFILIFLIFVPTPSLISGILVWFVVFIILRQITKRIDISLFLSFGLVVLLFVYQGFSGGNDGKYYFNKLSPMNYNIIKEGFDEKKSKKEKNHNRHKDENEDDDENIDDMLNNDDDDDDDDDETSTNDVSNDDELKKAYKANKELHKLNKTSKLLKQTLESLTPALNEGTKIVEQFKKFNLSSFL